VVPGDAFSETENRFNLGGVPDIDGAAGYQLVERDDYVHVALRGRPRLEMIVSMFRELEQLTTGHAELRVLIDESEMEAAFLSPNELRAMIDALKASAGLRHRSRIAIHAPSKLVYGLNRMAQAFAGDASEGRLEVFRSDEDARRWLLGT
jgi:stage II sporulation SpoAA-like protein